MAVFQPGVLAQGSRFHHHLEYDLIEGVDAPAVAAAVGGLREPSVSAGGVNLVIGFSDRLWARIGPAQRPTPAPFPAMAGSGGSMPVTQHDIWVWLHGAGPDIVLDTARAVSAALAGIAVLADEQPSFVYRDSRDLTGFIDGTENPVLAEAPEVVFLPDGPGAGGAHAILQRWLHDLEAFHSLSLEEQEAVFGRTKQDSVELDDAVKPVDAHIARTVVEDADGEELEIYRRSTAFGDVGRHGLMFVGFSRDPIRFSLMIERMVGAGAEPPDRLLRYSTPVTGSAYFVPSLSELSGLST